MSAFLDVVRDFLSVVGLTVALCILALCYKILMSPDAPTWEDVEVGIELSVASLGVVFGSLLTEVTRYSSARLLNVCILLLLLPGAAVCTRVWGYDAQHTLTRNGALTLSVTGALALIVTYGINTHPETAHGLWRAVWG